MSISSESYWHGKREKAKEAIDELEVTDLHIVLQLLEYIKRYTRK